VGVETGIAGELLRLMRHQIRRRHAPAVSVAHVHGEGPVIALAAGNAQLSTPREATPAIAYPFFSVTKLFTAAAVLQLAESGRVGLDEPISTYLTSFHVASRQVPTVRQLLTHVSGLANPIPVSWVHLVGEQGPTLDELTGRLLRAHPKLSFVPGTRFAYSNLNYLVLGQLIERVSGSVYEAYVTEHILRPLGAQEAGFTLPPGAATGYSRRWSLMGIAARFMLDRRLFGPTIDGFTELRPFLVDGAPYGGVVAQAAEILLLGRAMLGHGAIAGRRILQPQSVELALSPAKALDGTSLPIGLGWHLGRLDAEPFAYHLGGGGGFRSELRIYPRLSCAVAVVGNETSFPTDPLARLAARLAG
jgi:CubicO group peptidase (beta-lactamase class C family)